MAFVLEIVEPEEALAWTRRLERREPQDAFGPQDAALFAALKTEKRRRDWTGGRLAAKRAATRERVDFPMTEILVHNEPGGAPRLNLDGRDLPISITHTDAGAACALSLSGAPIGVDWEMIRPLDAGVLELAFNPEELAWAKTPLDHARAWTAKEAVIKFLKLDLSGLKSVKLDGPEAAPQVQGRKVAVTYTLFPASILCVAHG